MKKLLLLALPMLSMITWAVPETRHGFDEVRYASPPDRPRVSSWPNGLASVIAAESYLDGYNYQNPGLVRENVDTFYYGGDTEAINGFLAALAKVNPLKVSVSFSRGEGKVSPHVRSGTVRNQHVFNLSMTEIDGRPCTFLVSVIPKDWVRQSSEERIEAEASVLIFTDCQSFDVEKLRLPSWIQGPLKNPENAGG